jgi:antitoxin ParD1/3/4
MQITLTPKLEDLIREKVESGLYQDASEVIGEALRLLQEQDEARSLKLERLRSELQRGEIDLAQGRFATISTDDELQDLFARL